MKNEMLLHSNGRTMPTLFLSNFKVHFRLLSCMFMIGFFSFNLYAQKGGKTQTAGLLDQSEMIEKILEKLESGEEYDWLKVSELELESGLNHAGGVVRVGYQPDGNNGKNIDFSSINKSDSEWQSAKSELMTMLSNYGNDVSNIQEHSFYPTITFETTNMDLLNGFKLKGWVKWVDLAVNYIVDNLGVGCSESEPSVEDWYDVDPDDSLVPWHYGFMRIDDAWDYNQGQGVTVGLIDLGISVDQYKLTQAGFVGGQSSNRSIELHSTYPGEPNPLVSGCAHGTQMAGLIAGPRNGGSIVGVAYNSNLVSVRAADQVLLSSEESEDGVTDAITLLANNDDVKIISMSMGRLKKSSMIEDAIDYAHSKGKLIFCAAGTSPGFLPASVSKRIVIFPARMDEVVAVTGVKSTHHITLDNCDRCHYGDKVDFVVPIQRYGGEQNMIHSLALEGDYPAKTGSSSGATATMAGMAAILWSEFPELTRDEIIERFRLAASRGNDPHEDYGYGVVDMVAALEDVMHENNYPDMNILVMGPNKITSSGTYTWTANASNSQGEVFYSFSTETPEGCNIEFNNCYQVGNQYTCEVTLLSSTPSPAAEIHASGLEENWPRRSRTTVKSVVPGPEL